MSAAIRVAAITLNLVAAAVSTINVAAQCPLATITSEPTKSWSDKIVAAITGDGAQACYKTSPFTNSDCKIFVGTVLDQVYGDHTFETKDGYKASAEIAEMLLSNTAPGWITLGALTDSEARKRARTLASKGIPVVAAYQPTSGNGHVAMVGPGTAGRTGTLGDDTPVSASFFLGNPKKNYIGKSLSCAFNADQIPTTTIFAKDSGSP
jgi:hypothetical protein